jgi:predicted RNA-binding protein with PIN domain
VETAAPFQASAPAVSQLGMHERAPAARTHRRIEDCLVAYLVDGNNVMAQRVGWHKDKGGARRRLVDELSCFARSEGVPVVVVFDGAPDEHVPEGSTTTGMRVHYAARGSDADTRIKHLVERSPDRHSLVVVTSDRALADHVRRLGARVIRSGELRRRLEAPGEVGAAEDQLGASPPEQSPTISDAASAARPRAPGARRRPAR